MKRLLTALFLFFSFNTLAFECTDANTVVHPAYKSTKVKVEPTLMPVTTESLVGILGKNVKTFCIKGHINKLTNRQTIAIVQTGEYTVGNGKPSSYFFNFTDGWGYTMQTRYTKDFWWDRARPDWAIQCTRDAFTDVGLCSMFSGVIRFTRYTDNNIKLEIGGVNAPSYTEFCVRGNNSNTYCGTHSDAFTGTKAADIMTDLSKSTDVRAQYVNQYMETKVRKMEFKTTSLARHLTVLLSMRMAEE
ncbi:hypothetical protein [Providencia rettgeri]|uniref:hypothetical protein n=1 Tax=Providencia rettgeri TaxID=587 RepID=UPI0015EB8404|nr:hypothetical protein [Providencia rettgeri]QLR03776.1 hypothetical protein H0913_12600 [Providencia rettgeri]